MRMALRLPLTLVVLIVVLFVKSVWVHPAAAVELSFWQCWGEGRNETLAEYASGFAQEYPDVSVEVSYIGCGDIYERFLVAYAAGTAPDLLMIHTRFVPAAALQGALLDLSDYFHRSELVESDFIPSDFQGGMWEGRIYGLPARTGADENTLMFYGVNAFEKVGLDVNDPPQTWDDLLSLARRYRQYDASGHVQRAAFQLSGVYSDFPMSAWLYAGGGSLVSEDGAKVTLADQASVASVEGLRELSQALYRSPSEVAGYDFSDSSSRINRFISGETAIVFAGGRGYRFIHEADPEFEFRLSSRPTLEEGAPYSGVHAGTWMYAVPSTTEHPELAWELNRWMTTRRDTAGEFMLMQGRASAVAQFNSDLRYLDINPEFPKVYDAMLRAAPITFVPGIADVINNYETTVREVLQGRIDIGPALSSAHDVSQAQLKAAMEAVTR